jgi:hypothetical protein
MNKSIEKHQKIIEQLDYTLSLFITQVVLKMISEIDIVLITSKV